jgi:SET domain-containing protein
MLRVKTKLGLSHVDGVGLFADQFIPKGTITWKYDPEFDFRLSEKQINSLPEWTREQILKYSYFDYDQNCYVLCVDDQRFINHSIYPNIESTPSEDRAANDIQPGEELFCNYEQYEKNWFERRGVKQADFIYVVKAE